jgi:cyanophycinase
MSVHLVGGGWDEASRDDVYNRFLVEAGAHAGATAPRIAVLLVVGEPGSADAEMGVERMRAALTSTGPADLLLAVVREGEQFTPHALADAHGVVIGGGLTPAYRTAVEPIEGELRRLVAAGYPYLGFSAGAAIASEHALLGGWRIGGVPVGSEETGEELDEVTFEPGLGIVDVTIEAHAAQWGTLARLIAATEAGLIDGGIAIDEDTVLVVGEGGLVVGGRGNVWSVRAGEDGVIVRTLGS